MSNLPAAPSVPELEAIKDSDPDLYKAIRTIVDTYTADLNVRRAAAASTTSPKGPHSVTARQVGAAVVLAWTPDESGATVDGYEVWSADAGTRLSPTTPSFNGGAATKRDTVPASGGCLPSGSGFNWTDSDFTIPNLDPANPLRRTYWILSRSGGSVSIPFQATGTPIEILTNGAGDVTGEPKWTQKNLLFNAAFADGAIAANANLKDLTVIIAATNATPIAITTAGGHGYATNDIIYISGVTGNLAANGLWTITVTGATTFTLNTSAGSGAYAGLGIVDWVGGQPTPGTLPVSAGRPRWTPWRRNNTGTIFPQFRANGGKPTGEILCLGGLATGQSVIAQGLAGLLVAPLQKMTISIYARLTGAGGASIASAYVSPTVTMGGSAFTCQFSGSLLSSTWRRLVFTFGLPAISGPLTSATVEFLVDNQISGTCDFALTRPMLNAGDAAAPWVDDLDMSDNLLANSGVSDPLVAAWARANGSSIVRDSTAPYV